MIGRDRERDVIHRALDEFAAGGSVPAILVEGITGIGKSVLLDDAAAFATVPVRRAAGIELESGRPFGVVSELLQGSAQAVAPAVPPALPSSAEARFAVVDALVEALDSMAGGRPLLLVIDDLHWCDAGTTVVLDHLVRRRHRFGIGMVAAARVGLTPPALARSIRDGGTVVELRELEADGAHAVVCERLGVDRLGPGLGDLADAAGGHPLLLVELTEHLRATGRATVRAGRADTSSARLPDLATAVFDRLPVIDRTAREVLRAVAARGPEATVAEVVDLTARPVAEVATTVEELLAAGYLRRTDRGIGFRHELLRRALLDALPPDVVEELHRDAAWRLHAGGEDPVRVAAYLRRGARRGERAAIALLMAAAETLATRNPEEAVALLESALDLETEPEQRDALEVRSLWPLVWSCRAGEAVARAATLLRRHVDPEIVVEVRIAAAAAAHVLGRREDVLRYTEIDEAVAPAPAHRLLQLRAEGAEAVVLLRDLDEGEAAAVALAREAEAAAHWPAATLAWGAAAQGRGIRGWFREAVEHAEHAVRCGDRTLEARRRNKRHLLGVFLHHCDRSAEGETVLEEGLAENERLGVVWSTATHHLFLGGLCFDTGRRDDAEMHLELAIAAAEGTDQRLNRADVRLLQATFASHGGDLGAAERLLEAREGSPATPMVQATARLTYLDALGDEDRLRDELLRFQPPPESTGWARAFGPPLVRMLLRTELGDRAAAVLPVLETVAERAGTASAAASLLRVQGMIAGDPEPVLRGVELLRTTARIGEVGDACEEAADLLPARDARRVPLLVEAHGAGLAAGRVIAVRRRAEHLRRAGITPPPPKGDLSGAGWANLTAAERRVVDLVADGLTYRAVADRLHLSRRTVESHVAHVFQKLGVRSREQLSQIAIRRRG